MSWELEDAHVPAQSVSIRVHHWGHDCAPGTACPAAGVFPAGVCLQPSHGLTLRYRHRASVAGKAQQHPSLRRCDQGQRYIFVPGMPTEPRQTQATGYSFHTARTLALQLPELAVLPASQPLARTLMACADGCSVGWHLPSPLCAAQHPASLHHSPTCTPGCAAAAELPAQDSSAGHSLISGAVSATHTRAEHHEAAPP